MAEAKRPHPDKYYSPYDEMVPRWGHCIFYNYHILPDPDEVTEWIRRNAVTPVHLHYTWEEEGERRPSTSSKAYVFQPNGDREDNDRFERMVRTIFRWLEDEQAFTVMFSFEWDDKKALEFKTAFPRLYC